MRRSRLLGRVLVLPFVALASLGVFGCADAAPTETELERGRMVGTVLADLGIESTSEEAVCVARDAGELPAILAPADAEELASATVGCLDRSSVADDLLRPLAGGYAERDLECAVRRADPDDVERTLAQLLVGDAGEAPRSTFAILAFVRCFPVEEFLEFEGRVREREGQ